jgi:aspartate/tyrosine/aromatic aminotransferase
LREVVTNIITLCNHCPTAIDIGTPEWRALIEAAANGAAGRPVPAS